MHPKREFIFSCFIWVVVLFQSQKLDAQVRPSVAFGFGLPELVHVGVNFPFDQVQFGLSFGGIKFNPVDPLSTSITGDVRYYFGEKSKFTLRGTHYVRLALNILKTENESYINEFTYLSPKIGWELNFSKRFGVEFDLGAAFEVQHNQVRKNPPGLFEFDLELPVLPSASACLIYRL